MILPADFGLPPAPYLLVLAVAVAATVGALYVRRPPVTAATVTALVPWMAAGGTLYALYQAGVVPNSIAPLFGSPSVYVTVGVLAGLLWAAVAEQSGDTWTLTGAPTVLAATGGVLLVAGLVAALVLTEPAPRISVGILVATLFLSALAWTAVKRFSDVAATGTVGIVTVFGHTLDGISTAVGYGLLGFGEQTPLSRLIIEAGAALPIPKLLGGAWLFVLVKVVLGAAIVAVFEGYIRDEPTEGYLLLGLIAAVGLGPGFHNVVLFAIAG